MHDYISVILTNTSDVRLVVDIVWTENDKQFLLSESARFQQCTIAALLETNEVHPFKGASGGDRQLCSASFANFSNAFPFLNCVNVRGDSHCMFRVFARIVCGHNKLYQLVRDEVASMYAFFLFWTTI